MIFNKIFNKILNKSEDTKDYIEDILEISREMGIVLTTEELRYALHHYADLEGGDSQTLPYIIEELLDERKKEAKNEF